jgi:hypothetical protein
MNVKNVFVVGLMACATGCVGAGGAGDGAEQEAAAGDAAERGAPAGETPASGIAVVAPLLPSTEAEAEAMALSNEINGVTALIVSPGVELLATLELEGGSQVTWVRDSEGLIVGSQILDARAPALFTQDDLKLGPAETFRRLAPRQVVPARLLEAQRDQELRVARAPNLSTIAPVARALEPSSVIGEASQDDLFQAGPQNGLIQQAAIDDSKCPAETMFVLCESSDECRLWKTGDGKVARSDKHHVMSSACSYRGSITHRLDVRHWSDWKIVSRGTLPAGERISTLIYDDGWPTDFDFEAIIQNASGDGWHQAVAW